MSMQINSFSSGATMAANSTNPHSPREKETNALGKALASGDLAAAQAAYTTLTTDATGQPITPHGGLASVGQALQNGDLAGAQQAFTDMKTRRHDREMARNTDAATTAGISATTSATSAAQPSATTSTSGNLLNLVA